jgi:uncharacterized membrane protein YqjE
MSERHTAPGDGLVDSVKDVARLLLEIFQTRLHLLMTELAEEQAYLAERLLLAAIGLLCFSLGVIFVAFLIVFVLWETPYRNWAAGLIALTFFAVGTLLWLSFLSKGKEKPPFLSATLREFSIDRERLG